MPQVSSQAYTVVLHLLVKYELAPGYEIFCTNTTVYKGRVNRTA